MEYQFAVLLAAVLCASVASQQIPSYIKTCNYKSPDFNKCALENGNYAIPYIVKGDRKLGIPSLNPLKLPLVDVTHNDFKLTLKDIEVSGLENTHLKSINLDKTKLDAVLHIENLKIIGKYSIDGKVLLLTLQGEGPANITAVGGDYEVKAPIEIYTKNGENYLKLGKPEMEIKLQRAYFHFENLLNGDDRLGSEINDLLNESWEDVLKDLGAPIKETISTVIESIVSKITEKVPEKNIFP
ncbi:uncharacterized protein BDFB_002514, partial [Asbolus verrucosus]